MMKDNSRDVYIETLNLRQKKIEARIKELDNKIASAKVFTRRAEIEKASLKRQMADIANEKAEYSRTYKNIYHDSILVHGLDKVYDHHSGKEREINFQIDELVNLKAKLSDPAIKMRLDKKINKKREKLKKIQRRETRVSKVQRSIIMVKRAVHRKKYKLMKQEGKINYYRDKEILMYDLSEGLKEYKEQTHTITGKIRNKVASKVYDYKENKYRKKRQRREEVLKEMKSKRFVGVVSANVIVMAKRSVNRLREEPTREHTTTRTSDEELNQMFENQNNQNSSQNVR